MHDRCYAFSPCSHTHTSQILTTITRVSTSFAVLRFRFASYPHPPPHSSAGGSATRNRGRLRGAHVNQGGLGGPASLCGVGPLARRAWAAPLPVVLQGGRWRHCCRQQAGKIADADLRTDYLMLRSSLSRLRCVILSGCCVRFLPSTGGAIMKHVSGLLSVVFLCRPEYTIFYACRYGTR